MRIEPNKRRAFTLIEVLTASTLLILVTIAILDSQIIGLRMWKASGIKTLAIDQCRFGLNKIMVDVRSAYRIRVGAGAANSFTPAVVPGDQVGDSLQVWPGTNNSDYVRYYYASNTIYRIEDGANSPTTLITSITNSEAVFQEEVASYGANSVSFGIMTNSNSVAVVSINLHFLTTTSGGVGTNGVGGLVKSNFYDLEVRVAPRKI